MITSARRLKLPTQITRKLKWGVAGCGYFTENYFLPALQLVQRSKLVSTYSHDIHRAKNIANMFGAPNAFDDFDNFLLSDINAVYISGANSDHYSRVIKAAKAKKNILCERPIALSSSQAEEMVKVCKENDVIFIINQLHRFYPIVQKAKELIDKQLIGKIVSISASHNIDLAPSDNFRFNKEKSGGGVLRDLGVQMIDILRYFGGEIIDVKAYMDNIAYKSDVEDFASAIVKFEKSGYGYFNISFNAKKSQKRIEILGHKGSLTIEDSLGKKNQHAKLIIDLHGEARKVFRKRTNKLVFLIRSVQKSFWKNEPPLITGEEDLINMRVIEMIENNMKEKNSF
jgi:predicted dehydrogenase